MFNAGIIPLKQTGGETVSAAHANMAFCGPCLFFVAQPPLGCHTCNICASIWTAFHLAWAVVRGRCRGMVRVFPSGVLVAWRLVACFGSPCYYALSPQTLPEERLATAAVPLVLLPDAADGVNQRFVVGRQCERIGGFVLWRTHSVTADMWLWFGLRAGLLHGSITSWYLLLPLHG